MKTRLSISIALAFSALSASALAVDYAEERGVTPSVVPPAPDETGSVHNVPQWSTPRGRAATPAEFFARYDVNRDGVVSWAEAQADPDLVQVFARADINGDGMLTPGEFQDAAVLARGIAPFPRG